MYPYHYYYPNYSIIPFESTEFNYLPFSEDFSRQNPQFERRITQLERQNERQTEELTRQNKEIGRLNKEIKRINQELQRVNTEVTRLNDVNQQQTRGLQRLNQRLRTVERQFNFPFTPTEDGF